MESLRRYENMTRTKKIIFTYGLTYMAFGLAVQDSFLLSAVIMTVAIIILGKMQKHFLTSTKLFTCLLLHISLVLTAAQQYADVSPAFLMVMSLSIPYNCLHLLALDDMKMKKQIKVMLWESAMFSALTVMVIAGDFLLRHLAAGSILQGFWFLIIQLGCQIILTAVSCLIAHTSSHTLKSQLS